MGAAAAFAIADKALAAARTEREQRLAARHAAIPGVRDSAQGSEPTVMAAAPASSAIHRATITPSGFRQFHLEVDGVSLGLTPTPMNLVRQHFRGHKDIRVEFYCDGDAVPFAVHDERGENVA